MFFMFSGILLKSATCLMGRLVPEPDTVMLVRIDTLFDFVEMMVELSVVIMLVFVVFSNRSTC